MITVNFDYAAPDRLETAVKLLENDRRARILAGGLSVLSAMKLHRVAPTTVVDLRKIQKLCGIDSQKKGGTLRIGAMTPYVEIAASEIVKERYQALSEAITTIGDPQVRNRGTIGGSISHNDPAADLPAVVVALEAVIHAANPDGTRTIPAHEFFTGPFKTSLRQAEIVTALEFPAPLPATGSAYEKVKHPANGFAICGIAAVIQLNPDGTVENCRVAATGASDHAARLRKVEAALEGEKPTAETLARAAAGISGERFKFRSDAVASAEYRAHLTEVLTERALARAVQRAGTG